MGMSMGELEEKMAIRELSCLSQTNKFELHYIITTISAPIFQMNNNEHLSQYDCDKADRYPEYLGIALNNFCNKLTNASENAKKWITHHFKNCMSPAFGYCQSSEYPIEIRKQAVIKCRDHLFSDLRKIGC